MNNRLDSSELWKNLSETEQEIITGGQGIKYPAIVRFNSSDIEKGSETQAGSGKRGSKVRIL